VKLITHLHLVPRSKNEWSYTSIPQYAFIAWCSVKKKHRGNFILTFYIQIKANGYVAGNGTNTDGVMLTARQQTSELSRPG
jgi:hypothetical protein